MWSPVPIQWRPCKTDKHRPPRPRWAGFDIEACVEEQSIIYWISSNSLVPRDIPKTRLRCRVIDCCHLARLTLDKRRDGIVFRYGYGNVIKAHCRDTRYGITTVEFAPKPDNCVVQSVVRESTVRGSVSE